MALSELVQVIASGGVLELSKNACKVQIEDRITPLYTARIPEALHENDQILPINFHAVRPEF